MSDRPDRRRQSKSGGDDAGSSYARGFELTSGHLDDETLNSLVGPGGAELVTPMAHAHLESCQACQAALLELRATRTLLSSLDTPLPRRTFQLGPEFAKMPESLWTRLANALMPVLPPLRAATVAVALLLAAVSLRNALEDPASRGPVSDGAPAIATIAATSAPEERDNTAARETGAGDASETQAALPAPTMQQGLEGASANESMPSNDEAGPVRTQTLPPASGGDFDASIEQAEPAEASDDASEESEAPVTQGSWNEPAPSSDGATFAGDTARSTSSDSPSGVEAASEIGPGADEAHEMTGSETGADLDAQESTTLKVDDGDAAGEATSEGEPEPSMAMIAMPADASPPPEPSTIPAKAAPTATGSASPATGASPEALPTKSPASRQTTSSEAGATDGRDSWQVVQAILAVLLLTLVLIVGALSLRRRRIGP